MTNTPITHDTIIGAGRDLLSEEGENTEYDRAIIELTTVLLGHSMDLKDDVAEMLRPRSRFLEVVHDGGDFHVRYTGPLKSGKRIAELDRHIVEQYEQSGNRHEVYLCDDDEGKKVAEFGVGPDKETAWRYALGAYFGPVDTEYPGDDYLAQLIVKVAD